MTETAGIREEYGHVLAMKSAARERPDGISEHMIQCVWYDQLFDGTGLATHDGRKVKVVSPGWWNQAEGPDFKGAQIEFNGRLRGGDIEIHLDHGAWRQHGHHQDDRYNNVILEVVYSATTPARLSATSQGKPVPCLLLGQFLADDDMLALVDRLPVDDYPHDAPMTHGTCADIARTQGAACVAHMLNLAGDWRLVNRAAAFRHRMDQIGADQTVYEYFLTACGFSRYKSHFRLIAQQLPYDRVRQLARRDPMLVETALLQIAGLLPGSLPEDAASVPHFARLHTVRRESLSGLRKLPLSWSRTGVRPNNYPERRLAGAARVIARTATDGIADTLRHIWLDDLSVRKRRRAFEDLFPPAMGFWADHCTWTGKQLSKPIAMLGPGRVRSIIGNVFVPAGLARARETRDRRLEETVAAFYGALPKESGNHVYKAMLPRLFGDVKPPRLTFRTQQGLIQIYQDWCEPNPSCHNCAVAPFLGSGYGANPTDSGEQTGEST
ncbi:MAG: DUF2851 family protein [bacterium]|nr:DUF2851 family protein [bacterium]